MYEMEEGIGHSSTSLRSRRSSESDEQRLIASRMQRKVCCACIRVESRLILDTGTENASMASLKHIHIHSCTLRDPPHRRIPSLDPQRHYRSRGHGVKWNIAFRTYNDSDISRRLPCRLSISQSYADLESIHTGGHFAQIHAPQLSQRYLSKPLYNGDRNVPRGTWNRGQHILGPEAREGVLLHRPGKELAATLVGRRADLGDGREAESQSCRAYVAWLRGAYSKTRSCVCGQVQWLRGIASKDDPHLGPVGPTWIKGHWCESNRPTTSAHCRLCTERRWRRTSFRTKQHRNHADYHQCRHHARRHPQRPPSTQPHQHRQRRRRFRPRHGYHRRNPPHPTRRPNRPCRTLSHRRLAPLRPPTEDSIRPAPSLQPTQGSHKN
jgi:hypothetical protein